MAIKTWKVKEDSDTGIQISDHSVQATVGTPNDNNGLFVDQSGTYLRGPMSIMTTPEQVRIGGLWTFATGWQLSFPSTMAFPNPVLYINPSLQGVTDMAQAVSWMMSLLT